MPAQATNDLDMEVMKVKYGGGNEIAANTYINSLIHFTTVVQEVNKNLDKDKKIEVKIKANREGSFIVDFFIEASNIIDGIKSIFSDESVSYAANVIAVVTVVYNVAKHLKGKKPKEITSNKDATLRIENNDGQVQVFDFRGANIYLNNPTVKTAVEQEFETLENDNNVTDLEFLDKEDKKILEVNRGEFHNLSSSGASEELSKNERVEPIRANLNISSLDLEFKKKWDFYYLGNKISAKIKDNIFGEKIDKGERFGKGDSLDVMLEIKQEFDDSLNAFVNKSYTVTEVFDHKQKPTPPTLEFPNS